MTRLVWMTLLSLPFVIYYFFRINYMNTRVDNYSEEYRYDIARKVVRIIKRNGRIRTDVFGTENLPQDGGYVMYSNHQGKYDVLGIIDAHKTPCTFVIDDKRSHMFFSKEFTDLLKASRLDKTNLRTQLNTILSVAKQVTDGRKFIVFPEGGYDHNHNSLTEFLPGAFNCSVKSKTPIVPVALIDSYKVFGINSLKKVKTQVHFLDPIYYDEYKSMNTKEIANLVRDKIEQKIAMQV